MDDDKNAVKLKLELNSPGSHETLHQTIEMIIKPAEYRDDVRMKPETKQFHAIRPKEPEDVNSVAVRRTDCIADEDLAKDSIVFESGIRSPLKVLTKCQSGDVDPTSTERLRRKRKRKTTGSSWGSVNDGDARNDEIAVKFEKSTKRIYPEIGWNDEMRAFYYESWGGEAHDVSAIRKEMPSDPIQWHLDAEDLLTSNDDETSVKCLNCRHYGHNEDKCSLPPKEVVCFMCGIAGHSKTKCPNSICLNCGENADSYRRGCQHCHGRSHVTCRKCRRRGHFERDCPDNWRAYHNTIDPHTNPVRPPMNFQAKKFCSVCASKGHRAEQCYDFKLWMQDDIIPSDIRQYANVYRNEHPPVECYSAPTSHSLIENPRENFEFKWNVNESRDRFYGRFMEATGIQRKKAISVSKLNDYLVLNPLNVRHSRKRFAVGTGNLETDLTETEDKENSNNIASDNDVEMKELDCEESVMTERIDNATLIQEAIELDRLRSNYDMPMTEALYASLTEPTENSQSNKFDENSFDNEKSNRNVASSDTNTEAPSAQPDEQSIRSDKQNESIPLPTHIVGSSEMPNAADNSRQQSLENFAKIFLTEQQAKLLLSTEAGTDWLNDATSTYRLSVQADWENLNRILIVVGSAAERIEFHAELNRYLMPVSMDDSSFKQMPNSSAGLIRFIREQFALLKRPVCSNVNELFERMRRHENATNKNATKNADRARKNLNIMLMGVAGLRNGRLHLAGLERYLEFLLKMNGNTSKGMTNHLRVEIYQHYRYVFSSFRHDNYPELISEYEKMKRDKSFPPLEIGNQMGVVQTSVGCSGNVDQNLSDGVSNDTERAEEKHVDTVETRNKMEKTKTSDGGSGKDDRNPFEGVCIIPKENQTDTEAKQSTINQSKLARRQRKKMNRSRNMDTNAIWSLKCAYIVEQYRQTTQCYDIDSQQGVVRLDIVLEKAAQNQLGYADYLNLKSDLYLATSKRATVNWFH